MELVLATTIFCAIESEPAVIPPHAKVAFYFKGAFLLVDVRQAMNVDLDFYLGCLGVVPAYTQQFSGSLRGG